MALLLAQLVSGANAQQVPDASVLFPQTQSRITPPPPSPGYMLNGAPLGEQAQTAGEKFTLKSARYTGNTVFNTEQLNLVASGSIGQQVDLATLQNLSNTLSNFYRDAGYPFARVYLAPQDIVDGSVAFTVLEGHFGDVFATLGDQVARQHNADAQAYISALKPGDVMHSQDIERAALIMNDIPGYTAVPIVRPGAKAGAGDLELRMMQAKRFKGSAGYDNYGSLMTGQNRFRVDAELARNWIFGDVIKLTGLVTDGKTDLASVAYGLPLQANGLRLELSALHSAYTLGGTLAPSGFTGKSDIFGALVTYPTFRSQTVNITFSGALQQKDYTNDKGQIERYTLHTLPLSMNFDRRDQFNGGGVTYGVVSAMRAWVTQDNQTTASREPLFDKLNVDIARIQRLTSSLQGMVKFTGQYTENKIDSTEFISISGPNAVRAYPVGEFSGHSGWTTQIELSYNVPKTQVSPYVFYDYGTAINTTTTVVRELSARGLGVKYAAEGYSLDMAVAWPILGGASQTEDTAAAPRLWANLSLRF